MPPDLKSPAAGHADFDQRPAPGYYDISIRWRRVEGRGEQENLFRSQFPYSFSDSFLKLFRHPPGARSNIIHGFQAYGLLAYVYLFGGMQTRLHVEVDRREPVHVDIHSNVLALMEELRNKTAKERRLNLSARFFGVFGQASGLAIREHSFHWARRLRSAFLTLAATSVAWLFVKIVKFENSGDLENNLFVGLLVSSLLLILQFLVVLFDRRRYVFLRAEVDQNAP